MKAKNSRPVTTWLTKGHKVRGTHFFANFGNSKYTFAKGKSADLIDSLKNEPNKLAFPSLQKNASPDIVVITDIVGTKPDIHRAGDSNDIVHTETDNTSSSVGDLLTPTYADIAAKKMGQNSDLGNTQNLTKINCFNCGGLTSPPSPCSSCPEKIPASQCFICKKITLPPNKLTLACMECMTKYPAPKYIPHFRTFVIFSFTLESAKMRYVFWSRIFCHTFHAG